MANFGSKSSKNLSTCHPSLQALFYKVVKSYDCSVLCGHRGQIEQDAVYNEGKSQLKYPNGKHNSLPSMAVDVVPYPIAWEDTNRFCHFAGYVQRVADEMGINIVWGGDWKTFKDYPHFELKEDS